MEHQNQWKLARKSTILVGSFALVVVLLLFSQAAVAHASQLALKATPVPDNQYFKTIAKTLGNGESLDGYIISGPPTPPPGYERKAVSLPEPNPAMGTNSLTVPAYNWVFGCSSVSGGMIAAYYDRNGFPNMYTGPTDGGVMPLDNSIWGTWSDGVDTYPNIPLTASHNGVDGRTIKGSIDDYWVQYGSSASDPYITGSWTQHAWGDAIGDYMKTSQSAYGNTDGSTTFWNYTSSASPLTCADMVSGGINTTDGTYGRKLFYEARGYTVTDCYNQKTDNTVAGGFSFAQLKAEIDAGHPVMLNLAGHTIVGVGYDDTGNTVKVHDTWDYLTHDMTWGGSYSGMSLLSVSIVNLQSAVPTGILSGTVTDSLSAPIVGATIDVSGGHTTTTDGAGHYTIELAAATYSVTASKFGYTPSNAPTVVITASGTTTKNFTLTAAASSTVSGTVTDATTGWPLYASISIPGYPAGSVWTNPVSGAYSVSLPQGGTYAFSVNAWVPGYTTGSRSVGPLAGNRTENFGLTADTSTCNAPGYHILNGFLENFDSATPPALPANWAVVNVSGTSGVWATHVGTVHPSGVAAHSGTNLAYFNSWTANAGDQTRLYQTTGINMTTLSSSTLTFWMYHDTGYSENDNIQVQVSTDSGGSWNNVGTAVSRYDGSTGWKQHNVDLSAYASQANLRLGFLGSSEWGNDVHIDDISLGASCAAQSGGLVVGNVYSAATSAALAGATVSNDSSNTTISATTTDPNVDDGFYTLFSPAGSHSFTATLSSYGSDAANIAVVLHSTVLHNFHLSSASLSYDPPTLQATLQLGGSATIPLTLTNTGGLQATFELHEANGGFTPAASSTSELPVITQTAGRDMPAALLTNNEYFTSITKALGNGKSVDGYIINGPPTPPPGYELERAAVALPEPNPAMGTNSLTVPAYNWVFGCSSVSGGMIAAYYDRNGFPNMYTGPTDGGVMPLDNSIWGTWSDGVDTYPNIPLTASHNGVDGRTIKGSIDDYWVQYGSSASDPYITGSWTQHAWGDAIGDYMKTSQSAYGNTDGSTNFYTWTTSAAPLTCADMVSNGIDTLDGTYGRKLFYEARGYTVTDCYNQKTDNNGGGFTYAMYKAEIDAGHPVMLNLAGHTIVGVGYDDTGNTVKVHDTWDYLTHDMTWGGSYSGMQLLSVSIVNIESPDIPWLSESPLSGTIPAGNHNQVINVTFDASAVTLNGVYTGTLHVLTNDPAKPNIAIPVTMTVTATNPVPTTTGLSPASATAGGAAFTLTVNGTNFINGSTVRWKGSNRTTTYVSSTQLTASILAADIAIPGTASVTVFTGTPGGGTSNAQTFTINNPAPTTTGLSPTSATAGGAAFTLTVNGTNFINGSIVRWNGSNRTTTFVSSTQLTASILAADIATASTASVTVLTGTPGGGTSNAQTFTINNPVPTTTGLSPTSATAGGAAFTLTVNGTNFINGSIVRWNGSNRTTTYVSSTQLTASILAADIATPGTASVTVLTGTPGGGTSNAQTFSINNPVPTTTGLSPTSATAGGAAFTLTVNGTNFVAGSTVRWKGANRTTTYVSSTQLTASILAADIATAGTASVTVFTGTPGGGTSNAQTFTINNPAPTTTGLSPTSATAGGAAFTLTVNGTNFVAGSTVRWKGANRTTTYVSSTQLTAAILTADIVTAGTASVTVFNGTPGGGTSNAQTFTINNPVPTTTGLSPASATAGGAAFTLTVNGTNFVAGSIVRWNGSNRTTTYVSSTQLTVSIPATDIATAGTASVIVFNGTPAGGTSNAQTFTIKPTFKIYLPMLLR